MTRTGKKHKRGERGSAEEEMETPKRSNTATSLGQDEDISPATHQPTNESTNQNHPYLNSTRGW